MKCRVCAESWADDLQKVCPRCHNDADQIGMDLNAIEAAREKFRDKDLAYRDPATRIPKSEYYRPWLAVGLSIVLLFLFMRACHYGARY